MSKNISFTFSTSSIENAIKEIQEYKDELEMKLQQFTHALCEYGMSVAQSNMGGYGKHITVEIKDSVDGSAVCELVASSERLHVDWYDKKGNVVGSSDDLSPLLMAEFGAGRDAIDATGEASGLGGQGTYPNGTHGNNPPWHYYDADGTRWTVYGIPASQPMYKATEDMQRNIINVARQVFGV